MTQAIPKDKALDYMLDCVDKATDGLDKDSVRFGLGVVRFATSVVSSVESHFARYGLSQARYAVLVLLFSLPDEEWTPAKLASMLGVTRATLTGILDVLERSKLIVRSRHKKDGRMTDISLSDAGRKKMEEVLPDHFRRAAEAMNVLTPKERVELFRLLSKVKRGFQDLKKS